MLFLTLAVLAIAPGFFILWYIDHKDSYEKEPKSLIFKTFLLGALFVIPAGGIEYLLLNGMGISLDGNIIGAFIGSFFIIAPIEEVAKYFAVRLKAYRAPDFNSVMDGIVYGVSAAIGFATLENIFYVLEGGFGVALLRAFLSVPGHALEGAIIGYYMGMRKMTPESPRKFILTGLIIAILFHGAYDFVLFTETPLGLFIIPIIIILYKIFKKNMYEALKSSPFRQGRDEELFSRLQHKMTFPGLLLVSGGILLVSFACVMIAGSAVNISEGVAWGPSDWGYLTFFTVVPISLGIYFIYLSRKKRIAQ